VAALGKLYEEWTEATQPNGRGPDGVTCGEQWLIRSPRRSSRVTDAQLCRCCMQPATERRAGIVYVVYDVELHWMFGQERGILIAKGGGGLEWALLVLQGINSFVVRYDK
jgi:hypothetical protein